MKDVITWLYSFSFTLFGIKIDSGDVPGTITQMLDISNLLSGGSFTLYKYVVNINSAVTSLALSLITLFFMIKLIKLLTQEGVERISWERITLSAAVFFILVGVINNSMNMFTEVAKIVQSSILNPVKSAMNISSVGATDVVTNLVDAAEKAGAIEKYLYYAVDILLAIPYIATIMMVLSQVFVRAVKLLMYMMFSPIPIAMAAEGETYRGKAVSYIMNFAGVCFEAVIIYIGTFIYASGLKGALSSASNAFGQILALLFLNTLLTAIVALSSQLSDRIFGRG